MLWINLILKNIIFHKKQTVVAIISMSSVLLCYIIFQSYRLQTSELFTSVYENKLMYADLIIEKNNKNEFDFNENNLTVADQIKVERILFPQKELILGMSKHLSFQAQISTPNGPQIVFITAFDLNDALVIKTDHYVWDAIYGKPIENNDTGMNISFGLAKNLGCSFSAPPSSIIEVNLTVANKLREFHCPVSELQISNVSNSNVLLVDTVQITGIFDGIYEELDDKMVRLPLNLAQRIYGTKEVSKIIIKAMSTNAKTQLIKLFKNDPDFKITSWVNHEVGSVYRKTMSLFNMFSYFVLVILAVISFFIISNTLFKIISGRKNEYGLLLSIGYKKNHIYLMTLLEVQLLVLISIILSLFLYILLSYSLDLVQLKYQAGLLSQSVVLSLSFPVKESLSSFLALSLVSLVLSLNFMRKVFRLTIVNLLQH